MGEAITKRKETAQKEEGRRAAEIVVVESDGVYISLQEKDRVNLLVFGFGEQQMVDTIESLIEADDQEGFKVLLAEKKKGRKEKEKEIIKLEK
ncbi:hypothetical protein L1765_13740 [Microaerobacter geothermalis]|nr:hypothetical protein [Microaerobacter geothermalis]